MTNSFQSTAFQPQASPVDTFVQPVSVQPKSSIESLAETLAVVNPNIQKFLGNKIDIAKQEEIEKGQELVINASKDELQKIISQVKKRDGNKAARQLIGGNIFTQAGVEQQLAINLGNTTKLRAKSFFDNYTVQKQLDDGTVTQTPLSHYDINSPEFQSAMAEYQSTSKSDVSGIRSLYVNEYFLPKVSKAMEEIVADQIEKNNEYKVQNAENQLKNTLLLNFNNIDEDGLETSIAASQEQIKRLETIGLTEVVSPTSLLETVKDQANNIFLKYKRNNLDGFEAVNEYLDYVGELKVGPRQLLKDKTTKQSSLKDFYDEDIRKLYTDIIKANEEFDEQEAKRIQQVEEDTINTILDRHSFVKVDPETGQRNYEVVQSLVNAFPHRFDNFIEPLLEEQDISRDEFYRQFKFDMIQGKYKRTESFAILKNFEIALGTSITQEDETELEKLFTFAKEKGGKDSLVEYRSRIDITHQDARFILGGKGEFYNSFVRDFYTKGQNLDYIDAKSNFDNKVGEIFSTFELQTPYKTLDEQYATEFEKARKKYLQDVININNKTYKQTGIMSEIEQKIKPINNNNDNTNQGQTNEGVTFEGLINNEGKDESFGDLIKNRKKNNEIIDGQTFENRRGAGYGGGMTEANKTYTVKSGDTVEGIAKEYNISQKRLIEANSDKITNPNQISEGDVFTIPEAKLIVAPDLSKASKLQTTQINKVNNIIDNLKGSVEFGSGNRGKILSDLPTFITEIKEGNFKHVYSDPSSPVVIQGAKNLYAKLATDPSLESSQIRLAIAQMVSTEAIPNNNEDRIAVMSTLLNRIARARQEIYEPPGFEIYSTDFFEEILRKDQYEGIQKVAEKIGRPITKEDLINAKPIKSDIKQKDLNNIIDVLFGNRSSITKPNNNNQ